MRGSKYGSKKIKHGDMVFDSKKEFRRWQELKLLEEAGEIENLQRQVKYVLIPTQREPDRIGKRGGIIRGKVLEREVAYFADFVYEENGELVIEDVKGVRTPEYIIKRKMLLYLYDIRIKEI